MEIRALFAHTNCFPKAPYRHALNYNIWQLLSLQDFTAIRVQKSPPSHSPSTPFTLCTLFLQSQPSGHRGFSSGIEMNMTYLISKKVNFSYFCMNWHILTISRPHRSPIFSWEIPYCVFWGVNLIWYTHCHTSMPTLTRTVFKEEFQIQLRAPGSTSVPQKPNFLFFTMNVVLAEFIQFKEFTISARIKAFHSLLLHWFGCYFPENGCEYKHGVRALVGVNS